MKPARLLVVAVIIGAGCTGGSPGASDHEAPPALQTDRPSSQAESAESPPPRDARIYSAVIQQLLAERSQTRSDVVYVVNGAVAGAGKPRRDAFGPAPQPFEQNVIEGLRQRLDRNRNLPPVRFITDGNNLLRRDGVVKNGGVLISLGPVEGKKRRVLVANTFWCGGKCSQWQTYVVSNKNGRWRTTGVSGPVVGS